MSDTEMKPFAGDDSPIAALQRQVFVLLLVSLVVSATLAAYLIYESHIVHKDANNLRPQATQMMNAFNAERPGAEMFINEIRAFGGTHPEFAQQVLNKYGISALAPTNASAPRAPVKK